MDINWLEDKRVGGHSGDGGPFLRITKSYIVISEDVIKSLGKKKDGEKVRVRFGTSKETPGVLYLRDTDTGGNVVGDTHGGYRVQSRIRVNQLTGLGIARGNYMGKYNSKMKVWEFRLEGSVD